MVFAKDFIVELEQEVTNLRQENKQLQYELADASTQVNYSLLKQIDQEDIRVYELVMRMLKAGCLTDAQRDEILERIQTLHKALQTTDVASKFATRLITRIAEDLAHFEEYIGYVPGAKNKEYVRLVDVCSAPNKQLVVNKELLELRGEELYYADSQVQGIRVRNNVVMLNADHFSTEEVIRDIASHKRILAPHSKLREGFSSEKFIYFAEVNVLRTADVDVRAKYLGLKGKHANSYVNARLVLSDDLVWLRPQKGYPMKFAIAAKQLNLASSNASVSCVVDGKKVA